MEVSTQAPPWAGSGLASFIATLREKGSEASAGLKARGAEFGAGFRAELEEFLRRETGATSDGGMKETAGRPVPDKSSNDDALAGDADGAALGATAGAAVSSDAPASALSDENEGSGAGAVDAAAVATIPEAGVKTDDDDGDGDGSPTDAEIAGVSLGGGDADYASDAAWTETFDSGAGKLDHLWGGTIDTSVPGQITLGGYSGVMEKPSSADAGHGYGHYTVTAEVEGNQVGPAALLWPADDVWPGTEMDFVEVLPDGTAYGTAHRDSGGDWYEAAMYKGVDESQVHTYGITWRPDGATFTVDGREVGTVEMATQDAAAGGVNAVFGVMNQNPATSITVYEMTFSPLG